MLEQAVRARLEPTGHQVVEVTVHTGYRPSAILARAGLPLRIVFRREDDDACSERVVFSAPRLERRLAPTGTTTIDLPAQPPGEIRFTCGMGRYRGHIELVDEHAPSPVARFRDRLSRLQVPLGTALVLWICSLPFIALLAVIALDATAAVAAAAAALIAWLVGCLWASRGSAQST
jgi:plastocyanin domain-containing protein